MNPVLSWPLLYKTAQMRADPNQNGNHDSDKIGTIALIVSLAILLPMMACVCCCCLPLVRPPRSSTCTEEIAALVQLDDAPANDNLDTGVKDSNKSRSGSGMTEDGCGTCQAV